jgi:membrane-bound lytic murein transglycosylase D
MSDTLLVPSSDSVRLASLATPAAALALVKPQRARAGAAVTGKKTSGTQVRTHTVKKGDTLLGLARKYSTSVAALRALNSLKGNHLQIGNHLRIPAIRGRG